MQRAHGRCEFIAIPIDRHDTDDLAPRLGEEQVALCEGHPPYLQLGEVGLHACGEVVDVEMSVSLLVLPQPESLVADDVRSRVRLPRQADQPLYGVEYGIPAAVYPVCPVPDGYALEEGDETLRRVGRRVR